MKVFQLIIFQCDSTSITWACACHFTHVKAHFTSISSLPKRSQSCREFCSWHTNLPSDQREFWDELFWLYGLSILERFRWEINLKSAFWQFLWSDFWFKIYKYIILGILIFTMLRSEDVTLQHNAFFLLFEHVSLELQDPWEQISDIGHCASPHLNLGWL